MPRFKPGYPNPVLVIYKSHGLIIYQHYQAMIYNTHNIGEFKIQGIGKVDGYCCETNTVYEFHGDYWYGHPSKFNPIDTHPVAKKTYGELYQKTLARGQKIRDLGYNLVVMWEHEWIEIEKEKKRKSCLNW